MSHQPGLNPASLRKILGHFCSGLTIVASVIDDQPVGLTCQSFFSVSLDPPLVALAISKTSTTFPAILDASVFSVNVLAAHQREMSNAFARSGTDKWRGVDWHRGVHGQPVLPGAVAWFECVVRDVHDAGDHHLVVARLLDLGADETGLPLLYFRSEYRELTPAPGGSIGSALERPG